MLNFFSFYIFLQHHEEAPTLHSQGGFSEVFLDENSDFDPDVADSLSYTCEQVSKTGWQDSVEITVFRLSSVLKIQ